MSAKNETDIPVRAPFIAKETFIAVGNLLKSRRIHDYRDNMDSYFAVGAAKEAEAESEDFVDPAEKDAELKSTLEAQHQEGKAKMERVSRASAVDSKIVLSLLDCKFVTLSSQLHVKVFGTPALYLALAR